MVKATRGWCEPGDRHAVNITSEPPEEHAQRLKADYEMIGKLFREFNVKLD